MINKEKIRSLANEIEEAREYLAGLPADEIWSKEEEEAMSKLFHHADCLSGILEYLIDTQEELAEDINHKESK